MGKSHRRYIAVETAISIVINVLISALFMFAVFGRTPLIELWGPRGLAVDFIPQSFMIAAMSVLVPTLIARKRIREGALSSLPSVRPARPFALLAVRVLVLAALLTVVLGATGVALLSAVWTGPVGFWQAFPYKLAYGAVVALIATPLGLSLALSEPKKPHP